EGSSRSARPIIVEGGEKDFHRALAPKDDGVVVLHKDAAPGKVRRATDGCLHLPVDHDSLVLLELAQVVPLTVGRAGGGGETLRGNGLRGRRLAVAAFVVDDDFQPA